MTDMGSAVAAPHHRRIPESTNMRAPAFHSLPNGSVELVHEKLKQVGQRLDRHAGHKQVRTCQLCLGKPPTLIQNFPTAFNETDWLR
jgi:hypothetical protein